MNDKIGKIKTHFQEHKKEYVITVAGVVVGAACTMVFTGGGTQIVDSIKLIHIQWKSPNSIQTILIRRGHPGNIIRCNETGELFASQNRAAKVLGINPGNISHQLAGKNSHASGYTFDMLGEAS